MEAVTTCATTLKGVSSASATMATSCRKMESLAQVMFVSSPINGHFSLILSSLGSKGSENNSGLISGVVVTIVIFAVVIIVVIVSLLLVLNFKRSKGATESDNHLGPLCKSACMTVNLNSVCNMIQQTQFTLE